MDERNRRITDMKKKKDSNWFLYTFAWSVLAMAFAFLLVLGVWLLYPYNVVKLTDIKMSKNVVTQGEVVTYSENMHKYIGIVGTVSRHYVDGLRFDGGSGVADAPAGTQKVVKEITIPETLPPGKYILEITMRFEVNPIRTVEYTFYSSEFEVVSSNPHPDLEQDLIDGDGD